ncbi:MbtH-like protein [Streptomyces albus]|uniref:MbtH-like protein n=1 Tax=Streptomyces albus (strain ATCC 21838 / DSM 41398 / FERM P-419 / JCM 4703 / NBRC 107858) TaxID=1081613 RepID=A0A0B5F972_STRA4|nr:MbtH-like protein [Streptomyces albus]AOU81684.1 MbtH-like protein [Streptomyces albus]AYN37375.1 MbtH family protein [Streptomyces albus]
MTTNPFEQEIPYAVLVNDENQHSLWPAHLDVPGGWRQMFGPAEREECMAYVEREWTDMRPRSLAEEMDSR